MVFFMIPGVTTGWLHSVEEVGKKVTTPCPLLSSRYSGEVSYATADTALVHFDHNKHGVTYLLSGVCVRNKKHIARVTSLMAYFLVRCRN